jgi:hypothetical protein
VIVDDDYMQNEDELAEDEQGVDNDPAVSYIREQSENQARSKDDLIKKLAEKKRALLLK